MLDCLGEVCCNNQDKLFGPQNDNKTARALRQRYMLSWLLGTLDSAERGRAVLGCWTSDFAAKLVAMTLWPETRSPTEGSAIERLLQFS